MEYYFRINNFNNILGLNDRVCDGDGNGNGDRNEDDMIKTKHYLHNIIKMISKLSNIIAITTTFLQCRPLFVNTI